MSKKILSVFLAFMVCASALPAQEEAPYPPAPEEQYPSEGAIQNPYEEPPQDLPALVPVPADPYAVAPPLSRGGSGAVSVSPSATPVSAVTAQNKISLEIKGMDVVDVLKTLASRARLNIVVGKNVTGRVTLFLKDVEVWDAFEIVLLANDLAYERKGEIINVMTQRDYELLYGERYKDRKEVEIVQLRHAKAADLSRALNQMKTNVGRVVVDESSNTIALIDMPQKLQEMQTFIASTDLPIATRVFSLNYAQAEKLSTKLQEVVTKGVGSVRIDERTNKVAVTDYPSKLAEIEKIISAFDEKTPQILIDAQIVEINPKDEFAGGVDWDYWLRKNLRLVGTLAAPGLASAATIPTKLSFGVAARDAAASVDDQGQYKAIIDMVRVIGDTKILSSPRIMALNNQEAKILVGTKDAYITSTTSQSGTGSTVTSQSVNFVDVGIKLYVTPTANHEGFISMKIRPEISSAIRTDLTSQGSVTQVPIVTTSEIETTIMIKDGATIIIAGLKKDKIEEETKKFPLLGDIPIVGMVFRNVKREKSKSELIIFITPHIVSGEGEEPREYSSLTNDPIITGIQRASREQKSSLQTSRRVWDARTMTVSDYQQFISERIQRACRAARAAAAGSGSLAVAFTLDAYGYLKDEPVVVSSSDENLNLFTVACIKKAAPFPPFPASLGKDEEAFRINVSYE